LSERHSLLAAMLVQISEPNHGLFCIEPIYGCDDNCQRRLHIPIFTPNPSPPSGDCHGQQPSWTSFNTQNKKYMKVLQG
jgi:hypothetical protein